MKDRLFTIQIRLDNSMMDPEHPENLSAEEEAAMHKAVKEMGGEITSGPAFGEY